MKQLILILFFLMLTSLVKAQLYFPPNNSNVWETIPYSDLGWCEMKIDSLYDFLETKNTKAFILLKDGKIVLEKYFDNHTEASNWYWASAGKTLTAFMVGMAQQEDYLSITDTTSAHLGQGWTGLSPEQENKITIWHQLTMTTGLNDALADPFCTLDTCLQYKADAGTRWAYHNAPYTLLDQVIKNATGQTLNIYSTQKLKNPTGMDGLFIQQGYNNVFFSTARSMARFGLLILNKGNWNGNQILTDSDYFNEMVDTSQSINESYGYLWWLNGKSSFMIPQSQIVFNGSFSPDAPNDMFAALGKNGQFINVVPSQNLVWIRMGDEPDNSLVPFLLNNEIWTFINDLECINLSLQDQNQDGLNVTPYPNPTKASILLNTNNKDLWFRLYDNNGQLVLHGKYHKQIDLNSLAAGVYYLQVFDNRNSEVVKVVKE